jgi:mono/diheme cytochrome c family protein
MKDLLLNLLWPGLIGGALVTSLVPPARQAPPAIFTTEQAAAGKATFTTACASCHLADLTGNDDAPALAGTAFRDLWKGRSTKELFDYMAGAMPPGGSTLNAGNYASIVAYILERNGAAAGSDMLTPATAVPIGSLIK